jgi:nucleoside 2-deoxyribosyltransferase
MQVYFARSIRGNHGKGDKEASEAIVNTIKSCGHVPALETAHQASMSKVADTNEYIYKRDIEWIDYSQAMIADVSNPSLGVGYEIAYARHICEMPILAVARVGTNVSAMIAGCMEITFYRDVADLVPHIEKFLKSVDTQDVENLLRAAARSGQLNVDVTDAEIDEVLKNAPPIQVSADLTERALKAMREAQQRRENGEV